MIGPDAVDAFVDTVRNLVGPGSVVGVVYDENVTNLVRNTIVPGLSRACGDNYVTAEVHASEVTKSLAQVEGICDTLWKGGLRGDGVVVAVGGGILLNTAGVAASLILRGIPLISVPTTVLAAVDGVVSAKQAVNSRNVRNGLGTYRPPAAAFAFDEAFETLSLQRKLDGVFELAKNCLIGVTDEPDLVQHLTSVVVAGTDTPADWQRAIRLGVDAKRALLEVDPHETGPALIFEYGHTVAHWLEMTRAVESHGAAVGVGALTASIIAETFGLPGQQAHLDLLAGLRHVDLPHDIPELSELRHDRKRLSTTDHDTVPMLLSNGETCVPPVGGGHLWPVPVDVVAACLRRALKIGRGA
ncbi:MAG: iron-containing alcohol dehydrogenase [Mycobacterium sp.]